MKIAVIGAGGIGGYFGGCLAAAGEDVRFVVRSGTLAALRAGGLRIDSETTPLHLPRVDATDDPATIGEVDVVMFTVKLQDAQSAARLIPPLLGPRTVVVPFQNGVEAPALLAEAVPARQVAGGVAYISASIVQPGHIRHVGKFASLRVGALDPSQADALARLGEAGRRAGVAIDVSDDIRRALWEKFVFLVALSGLTAVSRQPIGVVRADPDLRAALVAAMREAVAVAHAHGVALSEDLVDTHLATVDRLPADVKASMAHDLDKGKPLEAPWLSGGVARLGAAAGVDTPVNRTLYAALKPYLNGRQ